MKISNLLSRFSQGALEAGCDEAGRGCLAGPVVAAAVILPDNFYHPLLNDSKQLSEDQRNILRPIIEKEALAWSVSFNSVEMIDKVNILNASFQAMHESIAKLAIAPELLLIDGNRFPAYWGVPHQCIIKGDGKFMSIAAASILAKTHRDEYMCSLAPSFPAYRWEENKGYGTLHHRKAITQFGRTIHHRKSFQIKVIDF